MSNASLSGQNNVSKTFSIYMSIFAGFVQMLVLGGGLLWGIAELKGDIRVINSDLKYIQRDISNLQNSAELARRD